MGYEPSKLWVNRRVSLFFLPASLLMRQLSFSQKTLLLAFVTVLSFFLSTINLYNHLDGHIKQSEKQLTGIVILSPIFQSIQLLQQYRGLSAAVNGGNELLEQTYLLKRAQVNNSFEQLRKELPIHIVSKTSFQEVLDRWAEIKEQGHEWAVEKSFVKHTFLVKSLILLVHSIADEHALTNHPKLEIYYLLNITFEQLITMQENLGQIRAIGTGILTQGISTEVQRLELNGIIAKADAAVIGLIGDSKKTGLYNPSIKEILESSSFEVLNNTHAIFDLVKINIFQNEYKINGGSFFEISTDAIDKTYETLNQVLIPTITTLIQQYRLDAVQKLYLALAISLLGFFLLLYLGVGIYIIVTRHIEFIATAIESYSKGDFSPRVELETKSELKYLAISLNKMASELARLVTIEKKEKCRVDAIIDAAIDALIQINEQGEIVHWSAQAESIFGWSFDEAVGEKIHNLIVPLRFHEQHINGLAGFLVGKKGAFINQVVEVDALHRDGHEFPIELSIVATEVDGGLEFNAFIRDISERKKAEEKLHLFAQIFQDANEGIVITNIDGIIVNVNPAFSKITGYSFEEIIGKKPNTLNSGKQSALFYKDMWEKLEEKGSWQGEIWNSNKDGELYAELLSISSIKDNLNKTLHYVGIFSDITAMKLQQERLALMAHYDELTKLPNRTLFADRFSQAIAHSKRNSSLLAVCFLDLDNFKPVNDKYGHDVGDQVLIGVAKRISKNIREDDTVSRQGGDEFALLLSDVESKKHCIKMLDRVLNELARPFIINKKTIRISVSIGVTLYPIDSADQDTLIRHADQAMYKAKLAGKNNIYLFNPLEDKQVMIKHSRIKEIELALLNNEMQLYYQPKVNMSTGHVYGVEALIRWIHPEKGLIPPLDFLPDVKDSMLEIQMGDWVINEAVKQLNLWKTQGIELEMSINISSFHLQSSSFILGLENILALYPNINSNNVQLEVLESSVMNDLNAINSILKTCQHTLGFSIALDDFGTGYSSLAHLRNLSVNTIKIDQSFVRDVLDDPNDYAIIDGVIGLADSFHRKIIAEGVETTEHGLMLLIMGCKNAQGYGISKPMPADQVLNWMENYQPNQAWIEYANGVLTNKENQVKLYKLALNQWVTLLENNIQATQNTPKHWPILHEKKCFCGFWLQRAEQELIFDDDQLKQLSTEHKLLHQLGIELVNKYQTGKLDVAREGLSEIKVICEKMAHIF